MKINLLPGILILVVVGAIAAAVTRYYFPSIQTKTVEVTKEVVRTDIQTVVRTITQPNGVVDTTTTTVDHSQREVTDKKQSIVAKRSSWNVSALVGTDLPTFIPIYGLSVSKEFIGPITIGAFGLSNGVIGLSVGLNF